MTRVLTLHGNPYSVCFSRIARLDETLKINFSKCYQLSLEYWFSARKLSSSYVPIKFINFTSNVFTLKFESII